MSERRFEQSINRHEAIKQELRDEGIKSPKEWREAVNLKEDSNINKTDQIEETLKLDLVPRQEKQALTSEQKKLIDEALIQYKTLPNWTMSKINEVLKNAEKDQVKIDINTAEVISYFKVSLLEKLSRKGAFQLSDVIEIIGFIEKHEIEIDLTGDEFKQKACDRINSALSSKGDFGSHTIKEVIEIKNKFALSNSVFLNENSYNIFEGVIIRVLGKSGSMKEVETVIDLMESFGLPNELIHREKVMDALLNRMRRSLLHYPQAEYEIKHFGYLLEKFNLQNDREFKNELIKGAGKSISSTIRYYGYESVLSLIKELRVGEALLKEIIWNSFVECINNSNFSNADLIREKFSNYLVGDIPSFFSRIVEEKKWQAVISMPNYFSECLSLYQKFIFEQKEIARDIKRNFSERQIAFDVLAGLAENGESSISQEFSEILKNRAGQKEISDSKWGLDQIQEAAFYILIRLDNPESNEALFMLLFNENVNMVIKYAVLKKLSNETRNFLNVESKQALKKWLHSKPVKELDWQDLNFIRAILNNIPSSELRKKSQEYIGWSFGKLSENEAGANKLWQEKYNNIPENTFLQLYQFVQGNELILEKFQLLYTSIRKEGTKKENLLYSIVNCMEIDPKVLEFLINKLEGIEFASKQNTDLLSELLRQVAFLNKIEKIKSYGHSEGDEDSIFDSDERKGMSPEILEIFSKEAKNLNDLTTLLREITTKKIQEILPNKNITAEKIEAIEKEWGNLEPIFTYLGRYPQLKEYIAEMAAQFSTKENWKNWRYDQNNKAVKNQVGHLSDEQLEIWKGDCFSEMGDIMIAESSSDKPKQIQNILRDAIVTHKHIFNPEQGQDKNEFIQNILEDVYNKINESPDKKDTITEEVVKELITEAKSIDNIINFNNIPRIKQSLESIIPKNTEIQTTKKTKDTINFLIAYLPKESGGMLEENYKKIGDKKKINSDELITPEIRVILNGKAKEIEDNYNKVLDSNIWEKLSLDKNNLKNIGQFYQKRQELKTTIDLLRLNNLSNKLIATNKIVEKEGKKGGETIIGVIDNLKKFFKDSPLLLDLKNIEFALKEKIDFGEKRRLAMMFTDNPQMLWQAGKYPLGNGSCQHYAEGGYANQLMGYVGDANCKVAYLVDLNKLSSDIKQRLEEKGFEEIKDSIPAQELLNASLARSIIKMTKDNDGHPTILLEPTYTVVYKGDASMDKYYNIFIDLIVADPMKAKMARGKGKESISKGSSRSPEGQYEDLSLSSVKFIHKLSKPTKEYTEIMERIRSSR